MEDGGSFSSLLLLALSGKIDRELVIVSVAIHSSLLQRTRRHVEEQWWYSYSLNLLWLHDSINQSINLSRRACAEGGGGGVMRGKKGWLDR